MLNIWDISTRLYHWLQAFLFFALISTAYFGLGGKSAENIHTWLGTVLAVLLIWRLGWGIFGSETSRFAEFLPSAREVWRYINGQGHTKAGHNPIGALMVIALIILLCLQGTLGFIMSFWIDGKEIFGRSVMRTLKDIHQVNALLLITLVGLHIIAAIVSRLKGQHLIRAMFTGKIEMADSIQAPKMVSHIKALSWLLCSVLGLVSMITFLS